MTISKLENSLEKQLRKQESQAAEMELRVKEATQRLKNENDELAELILQLEDEKDQLLKELAVGRREGCASHYHGRGGVDVSLLFALGAHWLFFLIVPTPHCSHTGAVSPRQAFRSSWRLGKHSPGSS